MMALGKKYLHILIGLLLPLMVVGCNPDKGLDVDLTDPDLSWSASAFEATIGASNTFPTLSNPYSLSISYSSSDTSVATVGEDGTVTLVAAGSTSIIAKSDETSKYSAGKATYILTVVKNNGSISWSATAYEATIGATNTFPTLSNPYNLSVSYSSSDTSVATIGEDGTITPVAAGSTSITALSAETDVYSASSASYILTVVKSSDGISWSASSCTVNIDDESHSYPTLSNPGGQTVTYTSSNENVATIDSQNGTITLVAEGSTTITAKSEANSAYEGSSVSYDLTVKGNLIAANLSWSEDSYTATLASSANQFPTLTNPHGLTVSYSSSDESVAKVSSSGTITLVGAGTTSIIASSEADKTYAAGSASYTLKVVKNTVTLAWSSSTFSVVKEEGSSSYPTLTVTPSSADVSISYNSSNTDVATIDSKGNITLVGTGNSTISAVFEGNDYYKAASASYVLTVSSKVDDGAVTTVFESAGDSTSEDDISTTTFTRLVTVTYSSSGASVSGYTAVADVMDVSISGNGVTITYTGDEKVAYKLTGSASDGYFKLYSSKKQALWLSGLTLSNSAGAAINNQSGKRTFVYVEGTNTLSDGTSASYSTTGDEDMKGVIFSEGQLIFSGSGSLKVVANNKQSKSGIVSDDYVRIMKSPSIIVTSGSSAGHGIKVNEYLQMSNGTLSVSTAAAMKKGIASDDYVLMEGGTATVTVTGGTAYDSEDGEYTGSAGIKADNYFAMTGGTMTISNSGAGGKGIRAGDYDYDSSSHSVADSYISGGSLSITTTGKESNDVSAKGMMIGWVVKSGTKVTSYAGNLNISGGKLIVKASNGEGIEAKGNLVISGGETYAYSTGDDATNSQAETSVTGGYVYAYSSANDAMDANHDMKLSGGYVFAICTKGSPEVAIDANTEEKYKLYINSGATVVAYGGLESGYSASQSVYTMSCTAGSWNALYNSSSYIAAFKAPSGISSVAVSAPSLSKGYKGVSVGSTTYANGIWAVSGISGGTAVTLSTYSGGGGAGGGGGTGGGGTPGRH